jgi:hypothetical protein
LQHLFGAGAHAEVVGEVDPANHTGRINQNFGRTGDIVAISAGPFVEQVVAADDFGVGVGEEGIGVAGFAAQAGGFTGRVHANGDGSDSGGLKFGEMLFDTP